MLSLKHRLRLIKIVLLISFICFIGKIKAVNYTPVFAMTPTENNYDKIILIDPGHGGFDGGAVSKNGTKEKDINLNISIKLRDLLQDFGYIVLMTRDKDIGLYSNKNVSISQRKYEDLNKRCLLKRDSNCHIFISIHQNYFPQSKYYGAQVWYSNSEKSEILGNLIQEKLRMHLDKRNIRQCKRAVNDYKILRCHPEIPSVIIECGFLSNPNEENKLKNETYQHMVAEAIAKAINDYFELET